MKTTIWKELRAFLRRLRTAGGPDSLRRECDEAIAWAKMSVQWVKDRMVEVQKEFSRTWELWTGTVAPQGLRPQPLYYQVLASWFMRVGAWFALAFECLLAGALSVLIFNLHWLWAVLIGVGITLAITYLFKGLFSAFFARYSQRPKQARDLLIWAITLLFPIQLILLGMAFLVTRSFAETAESLGWLFWPVTSLLALSTPLLAALLLVGTALFGWSRELADKYDELLHAEMQIQSLQNHATAIRPVILLLISFLAFGANPTYAQEVPVTRSNVTVMSADQNVPFMNRVDQTRNPAWIIIDGTASVEPQELRLGIETVSDHLGTMTLHWNIGEWQFFVYTNDGWTMRPFYKAPLPTFRIPECPGAKLTKVDMLFKGQLEAKQSRADTDCQSLIRAGRQKYEVALRNKLNEARTILLGLTPTSGGCTSFWDLLYRLSVTTGPAITIVITDGVETCARTTERIPAPKGRARVVVVLVSTKQGPLPRTPAQQFLLQRKKVRELAPWIADTDILAPFALSSLLLDERSDTHKEGSNQVRTFKGRESRYSPAARQAFPGILAAK